MFTNTLRRHLSTLTFTTTRTFTTSTTLLHHTRTPTTNRTASLLGTLSATLLTYIYTTNNNTAECCGIVGFVSHQEPCLDHLLEGLHIMQNRGYDSAGIATVKLDEKSRQQRTNCLGAHSRNSSATSLIQPGSPTLSGLVINDVTNSPTNKQAAVSTDNTIKITKFASLGSTSDSIDLLKKEAPKQHTGDLCGIAHTRWATHGGKTDENAHPHSDMKRRVALAHNGTIENSHELKDELIKSGVEFTSQTDTEVIVQLIGHYLDAGNSYYDSVKLTLGRLDGTWGLVIVHKDYPGEILAAKHGSPLVIGIAKSRMFVASEVSAFSRHTNQFIALKEGEIAVVTADGVSLDMARVEHAVPETILMSPAPFTHWTLKEIMEQPEAIARALNYGARFDGDGMVKLGGMEDNKKMLLGIKHLLIGACGTLLYAGNYGALLLQSLKCFDTIQCIDASEVTPDSFPLSDGGLLVLSQSGETKDTHRALLQASNQLIPTFSIVNQVGSLIARTTNCGVYLNAGREHAVASTKAFTTQVAALSLIAGWFSQNRDLAKTGKQRRSELIEAIHRLPIYTGMTLQCHTQIQQIAKKLVDVEHMFVLGKGYSEPIAREGALKIKEITYIHAEGYGGGALKHGPFALLNEKVPVVHIILDDVHCELMRIAAAETQARGTRNIIITDNKKFGANVADPSDVIKIPSNGALTALLAVIPLQMLAYEISVLKGYNPDKPRNLAKAVTVD